MLSHLTFLADHSSPAVRWLFERLFHEGYCGVAFFYVLSGFIISHAYRERLANREMSAGRYLWLRVTRIFPLHWATALAILAYTIGIRGEAPAPLTTLLNLLLLHSWAPEQTIHYSLNGPSWSISDEMFFYCAFLALALLRVRTLCAIAGGAFAVVAALAVHTSLTQSGYSPRTEWFFYVNPTTRLLEILAGMLIYEAYRRGFLARWSRTGTEAALLALVPTAMIGFSLSDMPMPIRWQLAYLPIMALTVLIFAHGRGRVSGLLRAAPLVLLGEASFALYLTHRPIVTAAHELAPTVDGIVLSALLLIACPIVAILTWRWFELPVQQWLRRPLALRAAA